MLSVQAADSGIMANQFKMYYVVKYPLDVTCESHTRAAANNCLHYQLMCHLFSL